MIGQIAPNLQVCCPQLYVDDFGNSHGTWLSSTYARFWKDFTFVHRVLVLTFSPMRKSSQMPGHEGASAQHDLDRSRLGLRRAGFSPELMAALCAAGCQFLLAWCPKFSYVSMLLSSKSEWGGNVHTTETVLT